MSTTADERRERVITIMDEARSQWMASALPGLRTPFPVYARPFADRVLALLEGERGEPRELLCMVCNHDYPVWFAPSDLWNRVVRTPAGSDRWPFLCPTCFGMKANEAGVGAVFVLQEAEPRVYATSDTPRVLSKSEGISTGHVYEDGDDCAQCGEPRVCRPVDVRTVRGPSESEGDGHYVDPNEDLHEDELLEVAEDIFGEMRDKGDYFPRDGYVVEPGQVIDAIKRARSRLSSVREGNA